METCTIETGLLKKKPCAHPAVTHCSNCEQPLCIDHAVPELSAAGKKTGKFMCKECMVATKEHDKAIAALARKEPPKAAAGAAAKPAAAPAAAKPAAPAAAKPAAPGAAPAAPKKEEDSLGGIDFTPGDKPK
jgi:hypothetical protein